VNGAKRRYALGVEYDGGPFCGWQSQPSGCSVQDALERALSLVAQERIRVFGAGRTDAGVHALGQVAHFDSAAQRQPSAWVRGANSNLPPSLAVRWARPVPPTFHARHSAHSRSYRYLLLNRAQRPGVCSGYVGWHHVPLDAERMREAAALLVGRRDFSAFRAASCQSKTSVRSMTEANVAREGDLLALDFRADAYLHHMVRNIVAALVWVGNGRRPVGWVGELLEGGDRTAGPPTFSASGLYLSRVEYSSSFEIPDDSGSLPFAVAALRG